MRLHLVGEYILIFPTGFLGFRIRRLQRFYSLSGIYFYVSLVTNILFKLCNETRTALNLHSGSQFELHTHSCVWVMNINRNRNISNQASRFYLVNLRTTLIASQSYRVNNLTEGFQLLFPFWVRGRFPSRSFFFSRVCFIKEFCKFCGKLWVGLLDYEREQATDC